MQERYEVVDKDGDLKGFIQKEPVAAPSNKRFMNIQDTKFKFWIFGLAALGALIGSVVSVGYALGCGVIGLVAGGAIGSFKQNKAYRAKQW
jgi:outer membrane lipoprotein SlyB